MLNKLTGMKKLKCILLIDDDRLNQFLSDQLLKSLDAAELVAWASNGQEALDCIVKCCKADYRPEVILLDLNMPIMNGFEFLEQYKNLEFPNKENTKIVIVASRATEMEIHRAKLLGIEIFVTKPLSKEKILEFLREHNG